MKVLFDSIKFTTFTKEILPKKFGLVCLILLFLILPSAQASTLDTSHVIGIPSTPNGVFKVVINPDSVQLLTEPSQNFMNAMTKSKAAADWWGSSIKTFDATGSLSGVFTVDVYNPVSPNNALNRGGAELLLRYNRSDSDPEANNLFWIQVVDSNLKNGEETTPYPDVYLSGYHKGKKLPFYYRPDETNLDLNDYYDEDYVGTPDIRSSQYTLRGKEYNYDLAFWGFPKRNTYDYWSGELFLASYDQADELVRIYDGVKWGFKIVPEPPSFILFLIPALFVFSIFHLRSYSQDISLNFDDMKKKQPKIYSVFLGLAFLISTEFSYANTAEITGINNHPFTFRIYHIGANDRPVPQLVLTTYPCSVKYCFSISADLATRIEQTMLSRFLAMPNDSDLSKAGSFSFYLVIRGFTGAVALSQPHSGEVFEALLEVIDEPEIRYELERRLYTGI